VTARAGGVPRGGGEAGSLRRSTRFLVRDLSRLELALSVCVIAVLIAVGVYYMLRVADAAERARLVASANEIRSALMLEALGRVVRGGGADLAALDRANPFAIVPPPEGYLGELGARDARDAAGGSWYFEPRSRELVYVGRGGAGSRRHVRFQVRLGYEDADGDGRFDPEVDAFSGVALVRLPGQPAGGPRRPQP